METLTHNEIITRLCQSGYPTYLVGGAIRDLFAGFDPDDFDITTAATPEQIAEVFKGCQVGTFGNTFGVTVVNGIDVATFRYDTYPNGNGAKKCIVKYADNIHDDLARRDLTINALSLCPLTGDVIDNHNGRAHLQKRIIKFVGDPVARITEDPNRIIRACRFLAKFQGTFDTSTLQALRDNIHLVDRIDPERVGIEVKKALLLPHPSLFFSALQVIGALQRIFPGFEACVNHPHGQYHKEDVWQHSLLAGDKISAKYPLVRLAGFLHDAGKPIAFARNTDGSFVGHEVLGSDVVNTWLSALKFSNDDRLFVVGLVRAHMWGGSQDSSRKAVRKLLFRLNELGVDIRSWLRLRIADRHANLLKDDFSLREIITRAKEVGIGAVIEAVPLSTHALVVTGGELITQFNLPRGPIVSKLQKKLLEFVLENGSDFNNREALLEETLKILPGL